MGVNVLCYKSIPTTVLSIFVIRDVHKDIVVVVVKIVSICLLWLDILCQWEKFFMFIFALSFVACTYKVSD